ncbi:MAG: radical SAM protein [Candidatus Wallbacteria bacterium]|nr:radical SAM protein [Candidatus Wallbacteria bacterium]
MSKIALLNRVRGWLSIEFTNFCNYACLYCYRGRVDRMPLSFLKPETLLHVLDDIEASGLTFAGIKLNWLGESTLHPEFSSMLEEIYRRKFYQYLSLETNLSSLPEVLLGSGSDKPLFIFVSLDTLDPLKFKALRGADLLPAVLENLDKILEFRRMHKRKFPGIRLQALVLPENMDELERFRSFAVDRLGSGVPIRFQEDITAPGDYLLFRRLIDPQDQPAADSLYLDAGNRFGISGRLPFQLEKGVRRACEKLWATPFIRADGSLTFCSDDPEMSLKLGNLERTSFSELWLGERIDSLRRMQVLQNWQQLPDKCLNCNNYWPTLADEYFREYFTF